MVTQEIKWKHTVFSQILPEFVSPISAEIGDKLTVKLRIYKENPIKEIFL